MRNLKTLTDCAKNFRGSFLHPLATFPHSNLYDFEKSEKTIHPTVDYITYYMMKHDELGDINLEGGYSKSKRKKCVYLLIKCLFGGIFDYWAQEKT